MGEYAIIWSLLLLSILARSQAEVWNSSSRGLHLRIGTSLPLTGRDLSHAERNYKEGLHLLVKQLDMSPFYGPEGPLGISIRIEDDGGNATKAAEIYTNMATKREVDFLLGPPSLRISQVLAEVSRATGVLALLLGAEPSLFRRGLTTVFTVEVLADQLMSGSLALVQQQKPRPQSLVAVWDASKSREYQTCAGAVQQAQQMGFEVLANLSLSDEVVLPQMRRVKALRPDLLVGCGRAEHILVAAKSLSFVPSGIVLTHATSQEFVRSVGAHLANYVMSPITWDSSLQLSCRLFGSTQGFVHAYTKLFPEEESVQPESAAAVASGLVLLAAVEKAGSVENVTAVREALLKLNLETCFARLAFNNDGTRKHDTVLTRQIQPLSEHRPRLERWLDSELHTLGPRDVPLWPLRSWAKKESDIYPCSLGEAFILHYDRQNDTLADSHCEKCPVGRYRNYSSVSCEDCEPGRYGMEAGMSQCRLCPEGGYCPGDVQVVKAEPGYYLLPKGNLTILPCHPPGICGAGCEVGNSNCSGGHRGILCQQCQTGYANPRFGLDRRQCLKCPEENVSLWAIALTVLIYVVYIWLIVKGTLAASRSIRAMHSVVLKICMNYVQFAVTAFEATEFEAMLLRICHPGTAWWFINAIRLPELLQYPLTSVVSLECLLQKSALREYQVEILLGLVLMPFAFLLMTILVMVRKECTWLRRVWMRCMTWLRELYVSMATAGHAQDAQCTATGCTGQAAEEPSNSRLTIPRSSGPAQRYSATEAPACSEEQSLPASPVSVRDTMTPWSGDDCTPASRFMSTLDLYHRSPSRREAIRSTKVLINSFATRFVNSAIVLSFVLHPVVVRMLVVAFECKELDVLRQKTDLDVPCFSPEHMQWLAWSTAGFVLYGLGTPVALFVALFRVRHDLVSAEVRKRYGFLYNGFELKFYYFEPVYMIRKVVILLFFTVPTMYVRMVLLLFTSFAFILLHVYTQPFDNRSYHCLDRLEVLSLGAFALTVSARLIFDLRGDISGQFLGGSAQHWLVDIMLVMVPIGAHAFFVGSAIWTFFRITVLRHLAMKAAIWPEKMTWWQKFILAMETHKKKVTFGEDERGVWLDASDLSRRDQNYLYAALCGTLYRYMDSPSQVYPADISAAVREALERCRQARRKRAVCLEQLEKQHRNRRGCIWRLVRWRGQLDIALHGDHRPKEEEDSCFGAFIRWAVPRRPPLRTLSERSRHPELEATNEFTAEEFFDALMPIWQDITTGDGPQLSPRQVTAQPPAISEFMRDMPQSAFPDSASMRQVLSPIRSEAVSGLAEEGSNDSDDEDGYRIEALLRRKQTLLSDGEASVVSGPLDDMLEEAKEKCRITESELVKKYDAVLAENLRLQRENEVLRRRCVAGSAPPAEVPSSLGHVPQQGPSQSDSVGEEPAGSSAVSAEQIPMPQDLSEGKITSALPMPVRPPKKHADHAPSTKGLGSPEAAQDASVAGGLTEIARPRDSHASLTLPVAMRAERTRLGHTVVADNGAGAARPCSHASLTLPIDTAECGCSGQMESAHYGTGAAMSGSHSHSCSSGKPTASPWSSALRPATPSAWSQGMRKTKNERNRIHAIVSPRQAPEFDFMAAARPVSPGNWSEV
eukprot:TRINITY_DN6382_c0_g4_i1.p1 TRINITY_DN6382_c0_g4~~TRINITY_DN6382_c0_g4_i1.p1  ORF type:complete len:1618 (-),score=246.23 TRINITY_DN6382_c0_g4_i1:113-4966(-)